MIFKIRPGYFAVIASLVVFLVIAGCIQYLDKEIAVRVMHFLQSFHTLHKATENIPDLLPYLVGAGTVLTWMIYFYRLSKKKYGIKTQFLFLSATALPAAYALKTFFQFAFGRISAREWLILKTPHRFNWFNDFGNGCFPSGHMTVFAAFGTAILIYYPQYRKAVIILLTLLGAALITTDYHYLSDVIAGAYLGVLTTYILWQALQKRIAVS
ncbi:MAG: phosphatase PAP2 family protein [Ignavibacteriaceae bacterium]|jgi:membrane-associated phospholipid phosphatase